MSEQKTPFSVLIGRFMDKVEKDPDFFDYFRIPENEAMEIAQTRAASLLADAVAVLMTKCSPDIDFFDCDNEEKVFNFTLTEVEINLLTDIMYELYLKKYIVTLKPIVNVLTSSDIKALYSPSNDRKTFQDLCNDIEDKNEKSISRYIAKDRITNKYKSIYK